MILTSCACARAQVRDLFGISDKAAGVFDSARTATRLGLPVNNARATWWWLGLSVLAACSATEGQLLTRVDQAEVRTSVRPDMSLQYQLVGEVDTTVDADLFVVDLFNTERAKVAALHAAGRMVVAYVSVGSLENWRSDYARFPRAAVGMPLASYPDESWLDSRNSEVRRLMQARFAMAASKGFDGVLASMLGAYRSTTGFPLTRADELAYGTFLAGAAHDLDLTIGLSGDLELGDELTRNFDWALGVNCIERNTCADLIAIKNRGLPVFDLESSSNHAAICKQAASLGIPVTFKAKGYDASRSDCG